MRTIGEGRIRFRLCVGITGHRDLADRDAVAGALRETLDGLARRFPPIETTEVTFEIFSALAEGADRVIVQEALTALGAIAAEVHAVLPLPEDDYLADFGSQASKDEFRHLLDPPTRKTTMPAAHTRQEAYESAGRYIVDHSDVVVAVWDGLPAGGQGGTAAIVDYARSRGTPVIVIPASRSSAPDRSPTPVDARPADGGGLGAADQAYAMTLGFNRLSTGDPKLAERIRAEHARLFRGAGPSIEADLERVVAFALPRYVRADLLAGQYQRWHYSLGATMYLSAALAVTAVAAQAEARSSPRLVVFEIGFMLVLLTTYLLTRRLDPHGRWLGYRSLAEAFRSGLFIALVKPPDRPARPVQARLDPERQPWFQRLFTEAWADRPVVTPDSSQAHDLRAFLDRAWIEDQLKYHQDTAARLRGDRRQLNASVITFFGLTVVVALVHVTDLFGTSISENFLIFLALTLPAFGAALTGIRDQHQYLVHEERSRRTASRLEALARRDRRAGLPGVQRLATEVQAAIEAERSDWWTVSEFQRVEMTI